MRRIPASHRALAPARRIPAPLIYLDHAATTPLHPEALAAMLPHLGAVGNPSSLHTAGRRARVAVDRARGTVADVLGCEPGEVVFTSGGTESDNAAIRGALAAQPDRPGLVTGSTEHKAVLATAKALAAAGHPVAILPPGSDGRLAPDAVAQACDATTGLVSAMWVNNETGAVNPVAEIASVAHESGALAHTDAVQAAGHFSLDVDALGVDLLSLSAHKLGGPQGVGALYVRAGTPFAGPQTGGAQERGRRGGTENVAGIVGFATALALAEAEREATAARIDGLRRDLLARLREALGDRLHPNTPDACAPHILSVSIAGGLDGEMLLAALDLDGVAVSAGSACTSGALEPSHVLLALGVPRELAAATLRFSLGRTTTTAEVARAADTVGRVVSRLLALTA
ncbi:cysteine desulfurase family protein [Rubrivirga sp. IMCC43871]|uniref:cysteine desulfurase family protein n=1 Tax=Rubrivirga sp. IMCC43871 TaxID=3391575 RepID=UPI0039901CCF